MPVKIAVLSDLHYSPGPTAVSPKRRSDIAEILLTRAVHRVNRLVRPDVTLFAGDLRDGEASPEAESEMRRLRAILDRLDSPLLAIPGNHDCATSDFYRVFERPAEWVDVCGVRFLCFADPEAPGFCATRPEHEIERMARARSGFDGPIATLQHVPLFPPGAADSPYCYTNAAEIVEAMRRHGVRLAVSGHYHPGLEPIATESAYFVTAPALCEAPFSFLEIDFDGERAEARRHDLSMPEHLGLVDRHVHTHLAYCNENMDIARTMELGRTFGLGAVAFSEHSDQLYFTERGTFHPDVMARGIEMASAPPLSGEAALNAFYVERGLAPPYRRPSAPFTPEMAQPRMDAYFEALRQAGCPPERQGLEVECDAQGRPVLLDRDRRRAGFLLGAVHQLPEKQRPRPDPARFADEFLATVERFLASGIRILAHPFRVFRRAGLESPPGCFAPLVRLLRLSGVAAEVNFHTNEPSVEFFRACIDAGVPLAFGSDSHNLYEVGDFALHLDFLRRCGYDGDPRDALLG